MEAKRCSKCGVVKPLDDCNIRKQAKHPLVWIAELVS